MEIHSTSIGEYQKNLRDHRSLLVESTWSSIKAHLIAKAFEALQKNILIITSGNKEERYLDDLPFFLNSPVLDFPSWETLPHEEIQPSPDIVGKRMEVIQELLENPKPKIVITTLQGYLQKLPHPSLLKDSFLIWKKKGSLSFDQVEEKLIQLGYKKAPSVTDKKEYAIRGSIIDLFPVSSTDPYRVDFFGDEIEAIRTFDPISQKTIGKVDSFILTHADELSLLQKMEPTTLQSYLGSDTLLIFDDLLSLEDSYASLQGINKASKSLATMKELLGSHKELFFTKEPIEKLSHVQKLPNKTISFEMFGETIESSYWNHSYAKPSLFFASPEKDQTLLDHLKEFDLAKIDLFFLYEKESYRDFVSKEADARALRYKLQKGYLSEGFILLDRSLAFIAEADISHKQKVRRQKWRNTFHLPASEFHALTPGDMVVHFHSGVGKYLGVEKQKNHLGNETEFMVIEYASQSKLYVPLSDSHLVSRYIGSSEVLPQLSQLGSKRWQQMKAKAQKDIMGYASDLLHLYAERELENAYAHPPDSEIMQEFERDFPYEETSDQLNAIYALKDDMGKKKPMDRLICGDVGYGKTEVAMRAAFKAVSDGRKQVAVLVPTTVLAAQHYDSFKERMGNYPIEIGILSRFQTAKQNKETIQKLKEGKLDIVIGTHRLLSKDVSFKDLGLIIIDEEQRFGVRAKEKLKKLKVESHSLTLSATPIPRTLYMSLVKARDMSVITTPPQDRLPIKTIISETSEEVVQNALLRELARGGQAFFIHNRVESILGKKEELQKLLPSAKIAIVHGQMDPDAVDQTFHLFKNGEVDLLLATTIIENGIDVPNANTILIDRADTFGLSELYQLRGRVGRWNKAAYAYFLVPPRREISEISRKRLSALVEASGYGGGMKIAMRDLEIRGAGDILGEAQSGQIASIGFHLYCKLLKRTIASLKSKKPLSFDETKMEFSINASLPNSYIPEGALRMEIYHRLGDAESFTIIDEIVEELKDRFGEPPTEVEYLLSLTKVRLFASQNRISRIKIAANYFLVEKERGKKLISERVPLPKNLPPKELEEYLLMMIKRVFFCGKTEAAIG